MKERTASYFKKLGALSDTDLDRSAGSLVAEEKRNVACLIAHLSEIDRRKIHLELGYKSVFEYATKCLCLSEGSVYLRMQVAGVCRRFPALLEHLGTNRINLSVAGRLAPHLNEENVEDLLSACAGKTKREVEDYLVRLREKAPLTPSIRKRPEGRSCRESAGGSTEGRREEKDDAPRPLARGRLEPARPRVYNVRFTVEKVSKEKLERLGEVLGIENSEGRMAEILARALDVALDRKDPQRRAARREKRKERKKKMETEGKGRPSRHVPVALRDRILKRGEYRCEYRGPDGRRCSQRTLLEVDHDPPWAMGTGHEEKNLRVLCRRHNQHSAERFFGSEFMARKIRKRRETSSCTESPG